MENHYLLYIDVLGFKDLVEHAPARVEDLFEIVASLNAHNDEAFSTIVFSDTILVHNVVEPSKPEDHSVFVMYQCEFFKDLIHRLAGRDIALRGVLTYGPFEHYLLNRTHYFYGSALNRAYLSDKSLPVTGLVMDDHCRGFNDIFSTRPFEGWHYVFVSQALSEWEDYHGAIVPLPGLIVDQTDLGWYLGPEVEILAASARHAATHSDARARTKHTNTLDLYRARYPRVFEALEPRGFRMEEISNEFDWSKVRDRMREGYSWASVRRRPEPGSTGRRTRTDGE
jgi:hypothetical protein